MIRIFSSKTQKSGEFGENIAVKHLKSSGFSIVSRNVSNKFGEIDIIARKEGIYHFFEVKTGREGANIFPGESLTPSKIKKFLISVQHYCLIKDIRYFKAQAIIVITGDGTLPKVEILELS